MAIELTPQAGVRLTSLVIMIYDAVVTVPSEIRLYRRQKSILRPSVPCILFILARYIGLFYICWVTYVFFGTGWTQSSCARVNPVGATFRAFASTISAVVFLWRTWAIWQRNRNILIVMGIALIPVTIFSYVPGLLQRAVVKDGGCTGVSSGTGPLSFKWTFALANLLYDTLAFSLATFRLQVMVRSGTSPISSILLADGLGYFVIAVTVQALNLVFLLNPDPTKQGTLLTFQTVTTSILAQRIITSLSERTRTIESSQHESSLRTRDRSHSRSRAGGFLPRPVNLSRPPALNSTFATKTRGEGVVRIVDGSMSESHANMEMVKIQVAVEKHSRVDDDDSMESKPRGV